MPRTVTHFGAALRTARRKADKTLGDVADLIGVTAAHLSDVERGNRKPLAPSDIEIIARSLGADFYSLLTAAARDRKEFRISTENFTGKQMEYVMVLLRGLHELSENEIADHVRQIELQLKAKLLLAQRGHVKESFGQRIRRKRTEAKLGLRETATKVGISPTYLSRTETAEEKSPPAEEVIRKLANLLNDDFDELMTLAGRVSEASLNVIKADSGMPEFLRTVGERKLSAEDLMKLLPNEPKKGKR